MKINIDYKLFKKKFINRKAYIVFLTFFVILELLSYCYIPREEQLNNTITSERKELRLKDAIDELKKKEVAFLNARKENETYLIDIEVKETKSSFLKKISELKSYDINDFNINFNENIINGKVTLKYSPKGEFWGK